MKAIGIAACLAAASCSFIALSDEITQSDCLSDQECDILNRRDDEDFDPCNVWQCADRSHRCEQLPPDFDRDGALPPLCVDTGQPSDCDDRDSEARPGHAELCDGKDNDCDLGIDEGMLDIEHTAAISFEAPVRELAYAWNPNSSELGVAFRWGDDQRTGFAEVTPDGIGSVGELRFAGSNEAVRGFDLGASLRVGRFIASLTEAESPHRTWVGYVNALSDAFTLSTAQPVREFGLRCLASENCATQPPLAELPPSTRAELSVLESQVLITRVRRAAPAAGSCEAPETHPALANVVVDNFAQLEEWTEDAVRLDESTGAHAPALVAIDATNVRSATEQFGWLAAYPDGSGDLIVRRLRIGDPALLAEPRLRIRRGEQPYSNVQLGLGSVTDNRMEIGLAVQAGCGEAARVLFGVLQLTWDLAGRAELRVYRELSLLGRDDSRGERPVLAFNREQASWGVAVQSPDGLFVRVLDGSGVPRGESPYRIRETAPELTDVAIVAPTDWRVGVFGVYSYLEQGEADDPEYLLDGAYLRTCSLTDAR